VQFSLFDGISFLLIDVVSAKLLFSLMAVSDRIIERSICESD
jgi:hypothetical protein